jgi:hypothetical protein
LPLGWREQWQRIRKVATASRRGAGNRARPCSYCAHHGKMPWPLLAGGLPLPLGWREQWQRIRKVATASRRGAGNRAAPCAYCAHHGKMPWPLLAGGLPSSLGRREKWQGKSKWPRRPAVARGIERLPPPVAHTTARCRGHSWREAFLRPSAGERSASSYCAHHGKMPWPLLAGGLPSPLGWRIGESGALPDPHQSFADWLLTENRRIRRPSRSASKFRRLAPDGESANQAPFQIRIKVSPIGS